MCQVRPPYSGNGKSYPTCGRTCARVLEYAVSGNKLPGTAGYTPPPPPPSLPTHAHTMPVYGNTPQINHPAFVNPNVDLASFLAGLSMASSNPPLAGNSPSRRPRGGHGPTPRRTRPHTMFKDDNSTTSTANFNSLPVPALAVGTDPCVVILLVISLFLVERLNC